MFQRIIITSIIALLMPKTVQAADVTEVYFKFGKDIPFEEIKFAAEMAHPSLKAINDGEFEGKPNCGQAKIGSQVIDFNFDDLLGGNLSVALQDIVTTGTSRLTGEYAPSCEP